MCYNIVVVERTTMSLGIQPCQRSKGLENKMTQIKLVTAETTGMTTNRIIKKMLGTAMKPLCVCQSVSLVDNECDGRLAWVRWCELADLCTCFQLVSLVAL